MRVLQIYKSLKARPDLYEYISTSYQGIEAYEVAVERADMIYEGTAKFIPINHNKTGILSFFKLFRICLDIKPDILVCHRRKYSIYGIMLSYFLPFLKVISVIHGDSDYRYKQRVRKVNLLRRKNTYFVAVSESTKKYVCAKGLKSVRVINNAIDVNFIHNHLLTRIEARQFLGVPENRYVIGTIGRLAQVKNHLFALKAFNNAYEHDQNLHMVIIGEGQQRPILEKFISDEKLGAAVTLAGAVESAFKFTRAFDLGFLSSKTEGLALALLEMLAANIPVVASDIPSFRSILPRDALFELSATACFSSMMTRPPYYKFDISLYDRSYYAKQWSDLILMESNNNV